MDPKSDASKSYNAPLNTKTLFILSTSGRQSSIEKHNKALRLLGANIVYFTFSREITPQAYAGLLRSPIVRGGAVTGQGLKTGIMPFLDKIDKLAKNIGAVNTVINNNGKLYGYNTDAFGFKKALHKHLNISKIMIKKAIIYGNGGVAGVAAHVLKNMGIKVTMTGRNQKRVKKKMRQLRLANFNGPYYLVVNATPISSAPLKKAIRLLDILRGCKMVFDHNMPEKEVKKNYLKDYCEKNKIYFAPGNDMYVPQMIKQWKLFLDGVNNNGNKLKITEDDIVKFWKLKYQRYEK